MTKLLIALSSEDLCHVLQNLLASKFSVTCCREGKTALRLLEELRPEALILDLSLPGLDGITLLERAKDFRPPVILATIKFDPTYVLEAAPDVGIGYIIKLPGDIDALVTRLLDMVNRYNKTKTCPEAARAKARRLLQMMNLAIHRDGYLYLQVGIPFFAKNPGQRMEKELYESIAKCLNVDSVKSIERSIRSVIEDGWKRRDRAVWDTYFPPGTVTREKGPSNKLFISRMAEEFNKME